MNNERIMMSSHNTQTDIDVDVQSDVKTAQPQLYRVVFHNDDVTPFVFVVLLLVGVFHKSDEEAYEITNEVHHNGRGVAGIFTHEIAEQKRDEAMEVIVQSGYPLVVTIEEDS